MLNAVKVVQFQSKSIDEFQRVYDSWIDSVKNKNENTAKRYETAVRIFCKDVFNKELKFVSVEDCENLKKVDVRDYANKLATRGLKKNTITTRLSIVKNLWMELSDNDYDVNEGIFSNIKRRLKDDAKPHNHLTRDELNDLINYIETKEKKCRKPKLLAVKLMSTIGIRKEAAFELEWSDFKKHTDSKGVTAYQITHIGKGGKKNINWISVEFYEELRGLSTNKVKVIDMGKDTLKRLLSRYSKIIDKKICIHSLRHTCGTLANESGKNIIQIKELLNHSSVRVTERYIHESVEIEKQASYDLDKIMFDYKI